MSNVFEKTATTEGARASGPAAVHFVRRMPLAGESGIETEIETDQTDGRRVLIVNIYCDVSASVSPHEQQIRESVIKYLEDLNALNAESVDVRFKVCFSTFAADVDPLNTVPQDPGELLLLIGEKSLCCNGKSTNIPALLRKIDQSYTRGGAVSSSLRAGDYKTLTVIITDYASTHPDSENTAARDALLSNQIYTGANETMVMYLGNEAHKKDAAQIAMRPENVMALGSDLNINLRDMLLGASLTFVGESTHLRRDNGKDSAGNAVEKLEDRNKANEKDAVDNAKLSKEVMDAFGLTSADVNV